MSSLISFANLSTLLILLPGSLSRAFLASTVIEQSFYSAISLVLCLLTLKWASEARGKNRGEETERKQH